MEKYCWVGEATGDNTTRRMRFACWITKATNTRSEYIMLIAFPLQRWLRERASILLYTLFFIVPTHALHYTLKY